jgi:parallel beta-helix repeat protein
MKGQNGLYDGNEVYNNAGYGFHIFSSGNNNVNNNILRNNYIHNNGGRVTNVGVTGGIILASGSNNIAYNNIICGQVNGYGIQIAYTNGGTNNQVYNNTIYSNDLAGIYIDPTAPNSIINNNIIYNNGSGIVDGGATGTVLSNNLTTDPKFVNVSANDFSLQASSPAINAGMTISVVTTDMKGVARPQGAAYDIGAYEYSQGTTPLPAPNNLRAVVQ